MHHSVSPRGSQQSRWSPKLVEELLFRQFFKGEDVSSLLPPIPAAASAQILDMDESLRCLVKFAQTGPALVQQGGKSAAQQQSSAAGFAPPTPPSKLGVPRTPNGSKVPLGQAKVNTQIGAPGASRAPTPKAADSPVPPRRDPAMGGAYGTASAPSTPTGSEAAAAASRKRPRERIEWPSGVPLDAQLKSQSRSAVQHLTEKRVLAQDGLDPDLIFRQNNADFPLTQIFSRYPSALRHIAQMRGLSGDWRTDTFTVEEEAQYKQAMGFRAVGPSQAQSLM